MRSRAYRQRRRAGTVIVPVEVGADAQKAMVGAGLINSEAPLDRAAIADGILVLLSFLMDGDLYFGAADEG